MSAPAPPMTATAAVRNPDARDTIPAALGALARGEPVIVVDDADRENEGDLVVLAETATTDTVAFLLDHTSGVICVALTGERCDQLELAPMTSRATDPLGTAFTVSVDAAGATTTGISAADRAATIRALADPGTEPDDLRRPGHVFPLRARRGGVRERPGHTEAAVDLARLAGARPAAVLCEVVSPDRRGMASARHLRELADRHGLPLVSIADLVRFRAAAAAVDVRRGASSPLSTPWGTFTAVAYHAPDGREHLAVTTPGLGRADAATAIDPPLVRLHSECLTGDVFSSRRCDCGEQLTTALCQVGADGNGAVVYLRGHEGRGIGLGAKLSAYALQDRGLDTVDANRELGLPVDARRYEEAAAILRDLGVPTRVRLLTNNPDKVRALADAGFEPQRVPLEVPATVDNQAYLATKRDRLGHLLARAPTGI